MDGVQRDTEPAEPASPGGANAGAYAGGSDHRDGWGTDVGGFVGHDEGLMTFGAGFEDAAFSFGTGLFRPGFFQVFAGQVNFNTGEVGVESLEEVVDIGSDRVGELAVH